jgi:hypothetical protein
MWGTAALLSAVQIFMRDLGRGFSPPWFGVLLANFLAWLPWLLIAPLTLKLERRRPLTGARRWLHAGLHAGISAVVSAAFLFYLALFHLLYLEGHTLPLDTGVIRAEYSDKLGRHFLTGVLLYFAILAVGFALRAWRAATAVAKPQVTDAPMAPGPFVIRSIGRLQRVEPADVHWIEGCGNYARLHLDDRTVLLRRTLSSLTEELGPARFVRIHKSAIVNSDRVAELRRRSHGEATLVLRDGGELKVSRTYRGALEKLLA